VRAHLHKNEALETIPQLFYQAVQQVMHANIAPMLALWSEQDDVTYCDPYGYYHQGRDGIVGRTDYDAEKSETSQIKLGVCV
jgi:hypothetical protein